MTRGEVLGPIEHDFRIDVLLLLLVAAVSIVLALLVAEFGVMRGVRALKTAALRLKAGRMGLRVTLPSFVAAELHDLATTYNAMTAEFERLAYLDRLTGLPNRRYLERHLAIRSERDGRALPAHQAVLAIDIDGFKPVNDSHGHAVGDRVLAIIARRIASVVNERGLLFRVGGDEFVAVIPLLKSQDRQTARELAEEIRLAMEQAIELDGLFFPVACSVGIAMVPDDAETLSGALVVADAALYEAKRTGRNKVVDIAPPLAVELRRLSLLYASELARVTSRPGKRPIGSIVYFDPHSVEGGLNRWRKSSAEAFRNPDRCAGSSEWRGAGRTRSIQAKASSSEKWLGCGL